MLLRLVKHMPKRLLGTVGILFVFFVLLTCLLLDNYHNSLMQDRKEKTRKLVENAHSLVVYYYNKVQANELEETKAKKFALDSIKQLSSGPDGYFWVMDTKPSMVMHPVQPGLDGTDLTDYVGPDGQKLFLEMVTLAVKDKQGYISYLWSKPGESPNNLYPKVSFIKLFDPWNWIIGSGVYVDDVDAAFWNASWVAVAVSFALLMFVMALAVTTSESIRKR